MKSFNAHSNDSIHARRVCTLQPLPTALVLAGLLATLAASAQTTAPDSAKDTKPMDSVDQLDRIVVTGAKREERLRDVAGTISALQGSDLEARGVQNHEDLFRLTPGVQFNKLEGDTSIISIRGIATSASGNFAQSTTGFYIEDIPFNDPYLFRTSPDVAPFDLQRVEVLRGPQGVLFGSSSMGGAVRYLLNKPNLKRTEFSFLGSVSSTSGGGTNHDEHVMANLPVGGDAGLRVVLFNRHDGGYVDNPVMGLHDTNKLHQSGGRLVGTFAPMRELKITATLMSQSTQTDDGSNITDAATTSKSVTSLSPRKSSFDLASLQVDYDFGPVRLTSTTGRLTKDWTGTTDQSRLAAFYGPDAYAVNDEHSRAVSQELRLASTAPGPLTWLAGAFWQRFDYRQRDRVQAAAFALPANIDSRATESSLFFNGEYALQSGWTLGAGGRFFRTRNDVDSTVNFIPGNSSSSESGFTPRVSAKFKLSNDAMVYALVSKGYRFGGINLTQFNPNLADPSFVTPPTYKSDSLVNYEMGMRLSPAKSVRLDATLFLLDWKELQLAIPRPGDGFGYTANIGKARSQGLELSAAWSPVDGFNLSTAVALTDAKTTSDYSAPTGLVASGTRLPGTARTQVTTNASYVFAGFFDSAARVSLTHSYVGKSYTDLFKSFETGGYSLLDARLSFGFENWDLSVFVNNATNKKAVAGVLFAPGLYTDYYINRPRTAGLSIRFDL